MTLRRQTRRMAKPVCFTTRSGIALAAVLLLGATTTTMAEEPTRIVEQYLSAWQAGDTAHMYELLTDDAKQAVGPQEFAMAFTVGLPFTDESYVVRPIRFDSVRLRPDSTNMVDYRAVFTVESLLGPSACRLFCADTRALQTLPDLHRARMQALCLLYDQARPDSHYVNIAYVLKVWGTLIFKDIVFLLLPEAPQETLPDARGQTYPGILPRVGLEADCELVVDTGALTMEPWQVSAVARPFCLGALEVSKDDRIGLPLAVRQQASLTGPPLCEEDFNRLALLMGLDCQ